MRDIFWNERNVFVTGVTGLIGSWLVDELVKKNANVVCLIRDMLPNTNFSMLGLDKKVTVINGNLEDANLLTRVVNEYDISTVFHLAAQSQVTTGNNSPVSTFEANITGTWNLLEACRKTNSVHSVIVASSDKAYGQHTKLPYVEDYALKGDHPYDVSKSCTDLISNMYANTYNMRIGITRCGNVYGGGDLNFNRIIPRTIKRILDNNSPILRDGGECVRDYTYISDIVNGYMLLAEKLTVHSGRGAFNFSTNQPIKVKDLVQIILRLMNREDIQPVNIGQASNEIKNQYLSYRKAESILGWKPTVTLSQGLTKTINWYKKYL
jgi:CDP-glucose 4,6-dehydratase